MLGPADAAALPATLVQGLGAFGFAMVASYYTPDMQKAKKTKRAPPKSRYLTQKEVIAAGESWMIGNIYIHNGYRDQTSIYGCLCSCGRLHNETVNVWTHFMGSLYHLNCFFFHANDSNAARWIALAAAYIFGLSSIAHGGGALGRMAEDILFRLDRASIAIFCWAFTIVCGFLHFSQREDADDLQLFTAISTAAGVLASLAMYVGSSWSAGIKVAILVLQITCVFVPVLREYVLTSSPVIRGLIETYLPSSVFWGALGGAVFACYFPEKYCSQLGVPQGTFDLIGHSHNLMHVCVVISAWFVYRGVALWHVTLSSTNIQTSIAAPIQQH